jgi:putative membrane protein
MFDADDPALAAPAHSAADAPPPPDAEPPQRPPAAVRALRAASARGSTLGRLAWGAAGALLSLALTVAAWDWATALVARSPVLGVVAGVLAALVALGLAGFAASEVAATARLGRLDRVRSEVEAALRGGDRAAAAAALRRLRGLYAGRADLAWALADLSAREGDHVDAAALVAAHERALMAQLDARAQAAAARAARVVAGVTAFVPMALVDVAAALVANLRMIRAVAEIYGGRAGWLGSWRLLKAVAGHLAATGAVAMADDLVGASLGGGAVAKLSRRFGEGLVNGALTARVGAAAIEVCRPLPFGVLPAPSGRAIAAAALTGARIAKPLARS